MSILGRNYGIVSAPRMGSLCAEWGDDSEMLFVRGIPGPWQQEPDFLEWRDPATDLKCRIRRNGVGSLCGYVCIGEDWKGNVNSLDVHGGITFDGHMGGMGADEHLQNEVWVGFDCSHYGDLSPTTTKFSPSRDHETYRNMDYVYRECCSLAWQVNQWV